MKHSLTTKISLTILLGLMLVIGLISLLASFVVNRQFEAYIEEQKEARSRNIVTDLSGQWDAISQTWNTEYLHAVGMYSLYDGYLLKIYDRSGGVFWDAENHDMTLCSQIMHEISGRMEQAKKSGSFAAHEYDLRQGGQAVGSVVIRYYGPYFYSESEFRFISVLNTVLLYVGIAAFAASIAVGVLLARRLARPITKTAETAQKIANGDYTVRLADETGTKELSDLAAAINHMSESLAEQEKLRRQLTADAAHELRTPLTSVGSHLEAMIEGIWEPSPERLTSLREEVLRLGSLVGGLERLAKADSDNLTLNKSAVDLLEIARSSAIAWEASAGKKGVTITVSGSPIIVWADRDRLTQIMTNLLSNALKYTAENGKVAISVSAAGKDSLLTVSDDGTGIPADDLPFIFERFYRADKSRNRESGGAGLGLAIVQSIAAAHGGTVEVKSELGSGSQFTVRLPAYPHNEGA